MIGYSQFTNLLKQFADNHKVGIRFISEFREQLPNLSTAEIEFPILFTNAKEGIAHKKLDDFSKNLRPLFDTIITKISQTLWENSFFFL